MPRLNPFGSMKVVLAVRNLRRSGGRLWVSLFGIAFATFLMAVQGSLLHSFTRTASRIVDSVDADLWIVGKGTPTFDYVSPIPERYAFLALGIDGVRDAGRGIAGWAPIQRPNGDRTLVMLIGVESAYRGRLPAVADVAAARGLSDSALIIDASDAQTLGFDGTLKTAQVAARRGYFLSETQGFASFLGSPLVFTDYSDAHRFLRLERTQTSFVVLHLEPGRDPAAVRDALRARLTDVDIWQTREFSLQSRIFWLVQTGAGGALTIAAILGFGIGLVLVAQTIYGITTENIEEYATMKAMGASNRDVRTVVLSQSLICGVVGGVFGLLIVEPFAVVLRFSVSWMSVPFWMYFIVACALAVLCVLASLIAAQPAVRVDPGRVSVRNVELRSVSLGFGAGASRTTALDAVDLVLEPGVFTLISGPSGSGKTSLISVLGAMITPDSGEVLVEDSDITRLSPDRRSAFRREQIGYVFQSFRLMGALSAEENICLSLEIRRVDGGRKRALGALEAVGLAGKAQLRPDQMSHGEKQRVALARAIAHGPKIVLADEPTASLDAANGAQVTQLLADIARDNERIVAVVTHDPRILPVAQRVIRLEDGHIVGDQRCSD